MSIDLDTEPSGKYTRVQYGVYHHVPNGVFDNTESLMGKLKMMRFAGQKNPPTRSAANKALRAYTTLTNIQRLRMLDPMFEGNRGEPPVWHRSITGHEIFNIIPSLNICAGNATLLDFFLENREIIPQEWRDTTVCFFGTTYVTKTAAGKISKRFVRCLRHNNGRWRSSVLEMLNFDDQFHADAVTLYIG